MSNLLHVSRPPTKEVNGRLGPPDILETIFQILLERHVDRWLRPQEIMALITASHVCKFWRQVALNSPRLWARCIFPDFQSVDAIEALFKRARSVPLVVESDCRSKTSLSSSRFYGPRWLKVMKALERIERLSITFDLARDDIRPLQDLVLKAAPLLQFCRIASLTLNTPLLHHNHLAEGSPMFDGRAKLLRCLCLCSSLLAPKAEFSRLMLTHLQLDMDGVSSSHPSLCCWLALLQGQPLLEFLTLTSFRLEYVEESPFVDLRDVSLPRLKSFHLDGEPSDCGELLRAITLPSECYTFLGICEDETALNGLQEGIHKLLQHWDKRNGSFQIYQWSLRPAYDVLRFQVVASGLSEGDEHKGVFTLHWHNSNLLPSPVVLLLQTMCSSALVKRQATIRLALDMLPNYQQQMTASLFCFFKAFGPNATELVLESGYSMKQILPVLEYPVTSTIDGQECEASVMLLPRLKSIALVHPLTPNFPNWDNIDAFVQYIRWRAEQNYHVPVVKVECPCPDLVQPIAIKISNFTKDLMLCKGPSRLSEVTAPACPRCLDLP